MSLLELIATRVVIIDGAMGTELQARGLRPGESGDWWSVAHPERVRPVHEAYREAGCDVLTTNSFGANTWVLDRYGYGDKVEAVNRAAATIAVESAGPAQIVLGDIGPSGVLIEPLGPATAGQLRQEFGRQARALLEGGAHGIIVETMSDVQEAAVAVEAANDAGAPIVIACMTFSPLPNGRLRTMMGVSPEDAARQLHAAGAGIVGINCGTHMGFDACAAAIALMRRVVDVPLVAMPNAGSPTWDDGRASYALSPAEFAEGLRPVVEAGAALIGGCCGTTPAHIAALREMIGA